MVKRGPSKVGHQRKPWILYDSPFQLFEGMDFLMSEKIGNAGEKGNTLTMAYPWPWQTLAQSIPAILQP